MSVVVFFRSFICSRERKFGGGGKCRGIASWMDIEFNNCALKNLGPEL
jgi:hypothetical protein